MTPTPAPRGPAPPYPKGPDMDAASVAAPQSLSMLIGGAEVAGREPIEVRNPARPAEVVGTIPAGTPADVEAAVAAARAAQPSWGARTYAERAALLGAAFDALAAGIGEYAPLYVRENGKTLAEAAGELKGVTPRQKLLFEAALALDTPEAVPIENGRTLIRYQPYGVVLSIVPWNAPVSLGCAQVAAALVMGNAVVVKPPETAPLTLMRALAILAANLPAGLVNIVTGTPQAIGEALTSHPDIGKIGFTGSVAAAGRIIQSAAPSIKSLTLELGGNDAAILLDDVDLSEANLTRLADGAFKMTGQVCMAVKRLYVPQSRLAEVVERLSAVVARTVVGNGLDTATTMGPLHTAAALSRAGAILADAEANGGEIEVLGRIAEGAMEDGGYFMRPVIAVGPSDGSRLVAEEQFSPILPILPYADTDEAIARANASEFGLGGSVWGADTERALALAARLQAGTVFVNTHGTGAVNRKAPYGGMKQSGIGRKAGLRGLLEYAEMQTITTLG